MTLNEYNDRMLKRVEDKRIEIKTKMKTLSIVWANFKEILKSKFKRKKDDGNN